MAEIQKFGTKDKLRSNEILTFGRAIEAKINELGVEKLNIASVFTPYKVTLQEMDDSIVRIRRSALTPEMNNADIERDYSQSGVLGNISLDQHHYDPVIRAYAVSLLPLHDAFVNKTKISYEEQTSVADNLIQELESEKYKAAVQALNLTGWVNDLKAKNEACKKLSTNRISESGTRNTSPKLKESRTAYNKAYNALVKRLNSLAEVNGDKDYLELFAWWNALIDRYRILLSNRLGAKKGGTTSKGDKDTPIVPPVDDNDDDDDNKGGGGGGDDRPEIE